MTDLILPLMLVWGVAWYLLPTLIAVFTLNPNFPLVIFINILTGWTGIGWLIALYLSFSRE